MTKDLRNCKSFIIAEIKFMPPNSSFRTFKELLSVVCKKRGRLKAVRVWVLYLSSAIEYHIGGGGYGVSFVIVKLVKIIVNIHIVLSLFFVYRNFPLRYLAQFKTTYAIGEIVSSSFSSYSLNS